MIKIKRALLSVSDKSGLVEFAGRLAALGVEFISTGGTAKALKDAGLEVKDVSQVTGFPEMLDGRVKTLHPKVHGGILARRDLEAHMAKLGEMKITPIDMVVVNLYPFQQTVADPACKLEDAVENIDIGGPTLIRAAAKNYGGVSILTDPSDYAKVAGEMESSGGSVSRPTRWLLAKKAYAMTAAYDKAITENLPRWDDEENC